MPLQIEPRISLGNILTAAAVAIGVVVSYVQLQEGVQSNSKAITSLERTVAANREFQIDQRVRVWNKVNDLENKISNMTNSVSKLEAGQEFIIRQMETVSKKLDRIIESRRGGN